MFVNIPYGVSINLGQTVRACRTVDAEVRVSIAVYTRRDIERACVSGAIAE